ncbi:hypothetical protein GCM10010441_59450 [Kitasatospora paracochleata]
MPEQQCPACGGTGVTERTDHTMELDADGKQVPTVHRYTAQCSTCGGTRVVHH